MVFCVLDIITYIDDPDEVVGITLHLVDANVHQTFDQLMKFSSEEIHEYADRFVYFLGVDMAHPSIGPEGLLILECPMEGHTLQRALELAQKKLEELGVETCHHNDRSVCLVRMDSITLDDGSKGIDNIVYHTVTLSEYPTHVITMSMTQLDGYCTFHLVGEMNMEHYSDEVYGRYIEQTCSSASDSRRQLKEAMRLLRKQGIIR